MKNPCDICIIKVNCTRLCWEKENNVALLKTAIGQRMQQRKVHPNHVTEWRKYQGLYNQCLTDIANIHIRAKEAREQ